MSGRAEIQVVQSLDRTQDAVSLNLNDETAGGYASYVNSESPQGPRESGG